MWRRRPEGKRLQDWRNTCCKTTIAREEISRTTTTELGTIKETKAGSQKRALLWREHNRPIYELAPGDFLLLDVSQAGY
jgi:hypothetical protein